MSTCIACVYYRPGRACGICRHYEAPADLAITVLYGYCPFFIEVVA